MASPAMSARARILAALTHEPQRTLVRARERAFTAADVLGAAAVLRPRFLDGAGPVGVAFHQPGYVVAALLASWGAGRTPVLFDPGLQREADVLRRLHPTLPIFTDAKDATMVNERIDVGSALAASAPLAAPPAWLAIPDDAQPFVALLTSASTGDHKLIEKRGYQMYRQAEALAALLALPAGGRVLSFVPPYHLLGFFYGLVLPFVQGAETVVATDLAGGVMIELLGKYRPELVVGSATHYRLLVRAAAAKAPTPSPATTYLASGAPLDPAVAESFAATFGAPVRDFYGSTELGGVASRVWPEPYRAMPGVRWRLDGDRGHLLVMSPWAGGAADVWLATDDAAEPTGDDGFRLLGRLDHVIKVGGKRFSTVEIEQAVRGMPGVAEVAVVTYERFGEPAVAAVVASAPGAALGAPEVRAFLATRLASFKLPRTILFVAALPKGSHAKVDYQAVRALVAGT